VLRRRVSWNIYSAILNPLVTFLASTLILLLRVSRGRDIASVVPLAALVLGSLCALVFWCSRLLKGSHRERASVIRIGVVIHAIGIATFLSLILATIVKIVGLVNLGLFSLPASPRYWIFTIWAILEGLQHFTYKLSFGRKDTLGYVLSQEWTKTWRIPLGGAIGIQLRRLRQQRMHAPRGTIQI
jgi:hypothetical protein